MSKPIVSQIYGYAVCLIGIVMVAISSNIIVSSSFDLAAPAESDMCSYYTSYASWSAGYAPGDVNKPSEAVYSDQKSNCEKGVHSRALKSVVAESLTLVLGLALFLWHWRWLSKEKN